jgi:hypothetical protein
MVEVGKQRILMGKKRGEECGNGCLNRKIMAR